MQGLGSTDAPRVQGLHSSEQGAVQHRVRDGPRLLPVRVERAHGHRAESQGCDGGQGIELGSISQLYVLLSA